MIQKIICLMSAVWGGTCVVATADNGQEESCPRIIAFLGDSNTWIGGEDCSKPEGWNHWFVKIMKDEAAGNNIVGRSYARSGATWTHARNTVGDKDHYTELLDDRNVIFNQVLRMESDILARRIQKPGIVFILAGTNDCWFSRQRPGVFSQTPEEVMERAVPDCLGEIISLPMAIQKNVEKLRSIMPETVIVLVSPSQSTACSLERQQEFGEMLEKTAAILDVPSVRLDLFTGTDASDAASMKRNTRDGVHTTSEGARKHAEYIFNKLVSKGIINKS